MFIRSAYNYDVNEVSVESGLSCPQEDGAKQEFKDECDINVLLRRFNVTGQLPQGVRMPTYGDFDVVTDFHSAANAIAQARESFELMPAEVRRRFNNDPGEFVDFCSNPVNREQAVKLGLVPEVGVKAPPVVDGAMAPAVAASSQGDSGAAGVAAPAAFAHVST